MLRILFLCTGNSCRSRMAEEGIDISAHRSKHVDDFKEISFNLVITVCDHVRESCPVFPEKNRVIHVGFDDPPYLARDASIEEEALGHYRRVRDEIWRSVETLQGHSSIMEGD